MESIRRLFRKSKIDGQNWPQAQIEPAKNQRFSETSSRCSVCSCDSFSFIPVKRQENDKNYPRFPPSEPSDSTPKTIRTSSSFIVEKYNLLPVPDSPLTLPKPSRPQHDDRPIVPKQRRGQDLTLELLREKRGETQNGSPLLKSATAIPYPKAKPRQKRKAPQPPVRSHSSQVLNTYLANSHNQNAKSLSQTLASDIISDWQAKHLQKIKSQQEILDIAQNTIKKRFERQKAAPKSVDEPHYKVPKSPPRLVLQEINRKQDCDELNFLIPDYDMPAGDKCTASKKVSKNILR